MGATPWTTTSSASPATSAGVTNHPAETLQLINLFQCQALKRGCPQWDAPHGLPWVPAASQIMAELGFHSQDVSRMLTLWAGWVENCGYVSAQLCTHNEYKIP